MRPEVLLWTGGGLPMNRFVIVKKDSALPCSQSTFAKIVPYFTLAAAHGERLILLFTTSEQDAYVITQSPW